MQIVPFLTHYQLVYANFDFSSFSLISYRVICRVLHDEMTLFIITIKFNAEGVVPLIAQGWRQPTLGYACSEEVNAVGVVLFLRGTTPSVLRFFGLNCH